MLYFLRSNTYYISFSDYRDYRAKVSTLVEKFCQLFHMHPISKCNGFEITSASEKHVVKDNILFTNHF